MPTFRRITHRDDPAELTATAAKFEAFLNEALAIARRKAKSKSQLIRKIIATGTAEGLGSPDKKYAVVSYRAEKYKRTWLSLIGWQDLEHWTPDQWAASMIETVEANVRMTETDSWPKPSVGRGRSKRKK